MKQFHAAILFTLGLATPAVAANAPGADPALVDRGQALVTAADCAACHMASDGRSDFSGGKGVATPMGEILASNITPDPDHGIGKWSLEQFTAALRKGRSPELGWLYPAMPYTAYTGLSDRDVKAIYSYLMLKVTPSDNAVKASQLPFPFIRPAMIGWNLLFLHDQRSPYAEAKAGTVERGHYLADTLEHCSTCHTPRNAMMAEKAGTYLGGADLGSWYAPNITAGPDGIGGWSDAQLKHFLATGSNAHAVAGGEMGTAVEHSISKLPEQDLDALVRYLRTVPAVPNHDKHPVARTATIARPDLSVIEPDQHSDWKTMADSSTTDGARLYQSACAACHGVRGAGSQDGAHPSLRANDTVRSVHPDNLIMVIEDGIHRKIGDARYPQYAMPGFANAFTPDQTAALVNYVRQDFGGSTETVSAAQVTRIATGTVHPSWLIANARALATLAIIVVVLVILALITRVARRRRDS